MKRPKPKQKRTTQPIRNAKARAAGLAATTRGRARTFDDKRKQPPSAREDIERGLKETRDE